MANTVTSTLSFKDGNYWIETSLGGQTLKVKAAVDGTLESTLSEDKKKLKEREIKIYPPISSLNQDLAGDYNIITIPRPDQGASLYLYVAPSENIDVEEIFNSVDVCLQGIASEGSPLDKKIQFFREIRRGITELQRSIESELTTTSSEIEKLDQQVLETGESYVDGCKRKEELEKRQSASNVEVASLTGKINALNQTIVSLQNSINTLANDLHGLHRHVSGWLRRHRRRIIREKEAQKRSYENIRASRVRERNASITRKKKIQDKIAQRGTNIQKLNEEITKIDHEKLQLINERVELAEARVALNALITRSDFLKEQVEIVEERMRNGKSFLEDIAMVSSGLTDFKKRFFIEESSSEITKAAVERSETIKALESMISDKNLDAGIRDGARDALKELVPQKLEPPAAAADM